MAIASLPRDGSAKWAAVVATTPTPSRRRRTGRQLGQRGVAFVVERMAVMGQLDADPVARRTGPPDRPAPFRGLRTAVGKCLADMAFAAAGQDVPVSTGRLGQRVEVVAQVALLAAGQMRRRQLARQPSIPLGTAGKHQQVRPPRIGLLGAVAATEGQFGTEHRLHVEFLGRLGEAHHPVEPVVIGQRDGAQIEPGGLLDEFLRRAGAVEEAVRRMRVQLGIRDRRGRPLARSPAADSSRACATRPGCRRRRRFAHRWATRHGAACR